MRFYLIVFNKNIHENVKKSLLKREIHHLEFLNKNLQQKLDKYEGVFKINNKGFKN